MNTTHHLITWHFEGDSARTSIVTGQSEEQATQTLEQRIKADYGEDELDIYIDNIQTLDAAASEAGLQIVATPITNEKA
jgi:hypothetical protein